MKKALTIAGSDSGGGAGIQADLKTFAAHGVWGTSAIAAITAQNTLGVTAALPLPCDIITAQIEAVANDIGVDAVKTGMLATAAIVYAVADAVARLGLINLVVDPVMVSKSGAALLARDAVDAVRRQLLPRAAVVTPNTEEAEVLTGITIRSVEDSRTAARRIHDMGPAAVVVKGGHLSTADVVDVLFDGHDLTEFRHVRVPGTNTHGTGCTFAAAIAAHLALNRTIAEAVPLAQSYVEGAIRHGAAAGRGVGVLNHFWNGAARLY
ncbi:MAG: bifunctional hydroxymethylpyrimidine kinase/phosphomethylpyrimidine kinase [Acidobacteria bacterium]|nr:bifunctional hydroxymethylpyrimidine kinase/phosphomethylpyrimidine kinase [Acidobacteriota bacterium]